MAWDPNDRRGWRAGPSASRDERHGGPQRRYGQEDEHRDRDERMSDRHRERDRDRGSGRAGEDRWSSGRHDYDRGRESARGYGERGRDYGGDYASGGWVPGHGDYWRSGRDHGGEERGYRERSGDDRRGFEDRRDYGRDSNRERDPYSRTSFAGSAAANPNDPHYEEWRHRQMEELDRDYDEYRRERQSHFESDFGSWRERRQSKRQLLGSVREHMEVVGSDNQHLGTVDRVAGDRIILTRSDPESGGAHHSLSCTDIDRVEGDRVVLDLSADQARHRWRDEGRGRALFEREDQGEAGPHVLDRSFSGTYRR